MTHTHAEARREADRILAAARLEAEAIRSQAYAVVDDLLTGDDRRADDGTFAALWREADGAGDSFFAELEGRELQLGGQDRTVRRLALPFRFVVAVVLVVWFVGCARSPSPELVATGPDPTPTPVATTPPMVVPTVTPPAIGVTEPVAVSPLPTPTVEPTATAPTPTAAVVGTPAPSPESPSPAPSGADAGGARPEPRRPDGTTPGAPEGVPDEARQAIEAAATSLGVSAEQLRTALSAARAAGGVDVAVLATTLGVDPADLAAALPQLGRGAAPGGRP